MLQATCIGCGCDDLHTCFDEVAEGLLQLACRGLRRGPGGVLGLS